MRDSRNARVRTKMGAKFRNRACVVHVDIFAGAVGFLYMGDVQVDMRLGRILRGQYGKYEHFSAQLAC